VILAGVRVAAVVSVGTATIAAAIGAGGLGTYVFRGLATVDTRLILAGAIPAALLALTADGLLGAVQKRSHPGRAAALLAVIAAGAIGLALLARSPVGARPVVVGSKNFTEQVILGEILGARLEALGFTVDRRLNLGGTALCHAAVREGQIDVYVEYSGTALTDILKRPVSPDPAAVLRTVRDGYAPGGLRVGSPLGFNNTFALVMRRADAESRAIRRISDLASHAATLRVGLFGEFLERADGMPGLLRAYGLRFALPPREMDLGLLYQALADGKVDLVVGSATDGLIAAMDLVVLEDDRHYFPPYDAVPVMNEESLRRHAGLAEAMESLDGISRGTDRREGDAPDELLGGRRAPPPRRRRPGIPGRHRHGRALGRELFRLLGSAAPSGSNGPLETELFAHRELSPAVQHRIERRPGRRRAALPPRGHVDVDLSFGAVQKRAVRPDDLSPRLCPPPPGNALEGGSLRQQPPEPGLEPKRSLDDEMREIVGQIPPRRHRAPQKAPAPRRCRRPPAEPPAVDLVERYLHRH
jgi:osmoprotectant transport system permease protein